jgi:hypothetical protein
MGHFFSFHTLHAALNVWQAVNDPTRAAKECRQVFRCGVVVVDSGATIHGLRLWEISRLPLWLPRKGAAATIRISLENLGNAEFCIYIYIFVFSMFFRDFLV